MALIAGVASFFSPCVLPLIPAYFTFITGFSLEELIEAPPSEIRLKVFLATLFYVLGFSAVFVLMGASAFYVGNLIYEYKDALVKIGAVVIILFGIHLTGVVRIRWLDVEKRLHVNRKPLHLMGTFFVGMAFGAGWSPCVGPYLGSIIIMAGTQETVWHGIILLGLYSIGLAVPFLVISLFINFLLIFIKRAARAIQTINMVAGILLVLVGIFLLTDNLFVLAGA